MTSGEIESFLFESMRAIVASDREAESPMVSPALSGDVYYRGMRPMQREQGGTDMEDIVVAVIAGNDRQVQTGSCVVNIYVPDIHVQSGAFMKDKTRTDMVEVWAKTLPTLLTRRGDILFSASSIVMTLAEESIHQHFVSLKMDFRLLNNDY